jgi:hypothetical protein
MNIEIFGENFRIWTSGAIKINSEKIKQINQWLKFDQGNSGYNLGIGT